MSAKYALLKGACRVLHMQSLMALPYLCFGGDELFSAAAESIRGRLEGCGVTVRMEIGEGMYHCYSAMPPVAEVRQGYENMIAFSKEG